MKVVKFGGSSLASAGQLEKVLQIIKADPERRFVIVSAPGKRSTQDTKVTDALIKYYRDYVAGNDVTKHQQWIIQRYRDMALELQLKPNILERISKSFQKLASLPIENNKFLYDTFLAAGENNNAKLIAAYFTQNGVDARYVHPREAGLIVSSEPGNARLLPSSYDKIEEFIAYIGKVGLETGGTGKKIRPVVSCKGTTCQYGLQDTFALSEEIHNRFYKGYRNVTLPHKFKIAVGGCPNNCVKPNLNDVGIIGQCIPNFHKEICKGCKKCIISKNCPMNACEVVDKKLKIDEDKLDFFIQMVYLGRSRIQKK